MTRYDEAFDTMTRTDHGYRFEFQWRWPRLHTYRAADPRSIAVALNRYPGVVIGVALRIGHRAISLVWGKPGRLTADSCMDCAKGVRHIGRRARTERDA